MKEGDIYRWAYKSEVREKMQERSGDPYWCKSRLAVVKGGRLVDTFWSFEPDNLAISPDSVDLKLLGNFQDLEKSGPDAYLYYDKSNIVDMRHTNSSGDLVYVRRGAARSKEKMREVLRRHILHYQDEMQYAKRSIERFEQEMQKLDNQDIDHVRLPWDRRVTLP